MTKSNDKLPIVVQHSGDALIYKLPNGKQIFQLLERNQSDLFEPTGPSPVFEKTATTSSCVLKPAELSDLINKMTPNPKALSWRNENPNDSKSPFVIRTTLPKEQMDKVCQ